MSPQKEKFSDSSLDPSEQDFDEIVNRPDMQALDDQGDAIARDLQTAENDPAAPESFHEDDGKDAARAAEAKRWNDPENNFYEPREETKQRLAGIANWSNRKKAGVAGGIGGGLGGILIAGFMLLPLKIPAIMQMIADAAGQRVENITEKRAKVIVGRYIISRYATNSGVVITGNGAVSTLFASMRTSKFEKKLEAKGFKFERSQGGVRISINGEKLNGGRPLKSDIEVVRAMESKPVTNQMLKQIIKEEIPSWRWMKRAKFAKWLRIKYGIPRYGLTQNDNPDEEARIKETQEERVRAEAGSQADVMSEVVDCFITNECPADVDDEGRPTNVKTSNDGSAISDTVNETVDEYVQEQTENSGRRTAKGLYKMVLDKLGSKAIPIVGWIDLFATIDHISWEASENDYFGKVVAYYRAAQYAKHFGTWSGYGSQVQLGAMDPAFIGVLASQTDGIEESEAFQTIDGNPGTGKAVKKINANSRTGFADALKDFRIAMTAPTLVGSLGQLPGIPDDIGNRVVHYVFNAYYQTIGGGGILGWLSEKLGDLITKIGTTMLPDQFENWLYGMMAKVGGAFLDVIGLDFDPMVSGPDWFSAAYGGADWSFNDFCKNEMGCRKLNPAQASMQNATVAADRADYRAGQGPLYALFSPESTTSLTTQLAVQTPSSASSFATKLGKVVSDTPSRLLAMVTGRSSAATYVDLYGIDPYGALESELDKPLDPRAVAGEDCGDEFDGQTLNLCQTDTMVAEAILCEFDPENTECSDEDGSTSIGTGEGASFRIASFNIYHATDSIWRQRLDRSINVIKSNKIDVVGLQEVRDVQMQALKEAGAAGELSSNGDTFAIYPETFKGRGAGFVSENSIIYNSQKFSLVSAEEVDFMYFDGAQRKLPKIKLRFNETGQEIYVLNTHDPAYPENAKARYDNAVYYKGYLANLKTEGLPIFFTGDFNAGFSQRYGNKNTTYQGKDANLTYCVLTSDNVMANAYDVAENRPVKCPNPGNDNAVDHIFLTPGVQVTDFFKVRKGKLTGNGSDAHDTQIADIVIAGASSETGGGTDPIPYKNPVFAGNTPDPAVIRADDGAYHVYATGGTFADPYQHLVSKDLVTWERSGRVLAAGSVPSWLKGERWAPDAAKVGSNYILTFSGSPSDCAGKRRIGYAVSTNAGGPFTYKGELVNDGSLGCGYDIDPKIAETSAGTFLYYGSGPSLSVIKISVSADGTIKKEAARKTILTLGSDSTLVEGAWLHEKDGWYYLFYSDGQFATKSGSAEYSTKIARSKSPTGPFVKRGTSVLEGRDPFRGPGHNSVTSDNAGNDWIVYHAWSGANRSLMIDPIKYVDGWPVVRSGYPSSGTQSDGPANGGGDGTGSTGGTMDWPVKKENWPAGSPIADCNLLYDSEGGTIHTGIDISLPMNTPIYAAAAGKVVYESAGYGMVTIETGLKRNGTPVFINYQHLASNSVNVGDRVEKGKQIGQSGKTGTDSPHLHFSTWKKAGPLSGHVLPGNTDADENMYHPMSFLPKDGRNIAGCKEPYDVPH